MSTRSIIIIKNSKSLNRIYKHCDGYPTDALRVIAESLESVNRKTVTAVASKVCDIASLEIEHKAKDSIINDENLDYQSDLEWIYIVDLSEKRVDVFGGGYKDITPLEHVAKGRVNPASYADNLYPEYQEKEVARISESIDRLSGLGFPVNPQSEMSTFDDLLKETA